MPEPVESFHWKILRVGSLRECLDAWQGSKLFAKLNDSLRNAASLAIDELGSNFLRFSGPRATAMKLTITFDGKEIELTFDDDGAPFDPGSILPPPRGNVGLLPVGGRGLHMVRQSMESWNYRLKDGHNVSVLKKRMAKDPLAEEPAAPAPEPDRK